MNNNSTLYGYFGIILAILGWGLSNSFIKFGLDNINPYFFLSLRFIVAGIIFTPYIILFKRKIFIQYLSNKWIWIIAFFEFMGLEFQYFGQQFVSASLATLLCLQFVVIVPILSIKFLNEPVSKVTIASTIFALSGTYFISTNGDFSDFFINLNVGGLVLLLAALAYSLYLIVSSHFTTNIDTSIDSSVMFYNIIVGIALFSLIPTISFSSSYTIDSSVWIWIIALATFSTLVPFFGYFLGLKVVSANTMSLVLLFQITVPFAIDIFFLGITYSYWIIVGSFLILSSLIVVAVKPLINRQHLDQKLFPKDLYSISE